MVAGVSLAVNLGVADRPAELDVRRILGVRKCLSIALALDDVEGTGSGGGELSSTLPAPVVVSCGAMIDGCSSERVIATVWSVTSVPPTATTGGSRTRYSPRAR
ncbi:MAG: hypothetical protein V5A56_13505 [Halolamina sp.]